MNYQQATHIIILLGVFVFLLFITKVFRELLFKTALLLHDELLHDEEEEPSNLTDHTDKDIPCFAEEDLKNAKKNDINNNKADV